VQAERQGHDLVSDRRVQVGEGAQPLVPVVRGKAGTYEGNLVIKEGV
jgi:hypothetical protein